MAVIVTLIPAVVLAQAVPEMKYEDTVRIKEGYHLLKTVGEKIWEGWSEVPIPINFVASTSSASNFCPEWGGKWHVPAEDLKPYRAEVVPIIVLIQKDGTVSFTHTGEMKKEDLYDQVRKLFNR